MFIYRIINEKELLARAQGINNWISENLNNIGNANMHEITSLMIARNNIQLLNGSNSSVDNEINKMIELRKESIEDFHKDVPECEALFNAVKDGLTGDSIEEMELIIACQRVPFYIDNRRKRGDADIKMSLEIQESQSFKSFEHDNFGEIIGMVDSYNTASDEVKKATYPVVNWAINNSISAIRDNISISPIENTKTFVK